MTMRWVILLAILALYGLFEGYVFQGAKAAFREGTTRHIVLSLHWLGVTATVLTFVALFAFGRGSFTWWTNLLIGLMVTFLVTKLVFAAVLVSEDLFRFVKYGFEQFAALWKTEPSPVNVDERRSFLGYAGLAIAAIPFSSFLYGIVKGKYNFKVHRVTLSFPDLPKAFDGFRIAHISDIHAGSFDSYEAVAQGVKMIQDTRPDAVLFTGDLVNNRASEVEPYVSLFKGLQAPFGKFSVLGNHDYGTYVRWPSQQAWKQNLQTLLGHQKEMGFKVLNNESVALQKDGESIRIAGVENWGKPPFPQRGDLGRALAAGKADDFTVLLSHDPSHWDAQVLSHPKPVHLTLSGHTHGMQMGIEIPGLRWSPVKYRYARWAGAYESQGRFLYVNRGFGFLGFPGRVGIWPEITVIELKTA